MESKFSKYKKTSYGIFSKVENKFQNTNDKEIKLSKNTLSFHETIFKKYFKDYYPNVDKEILVILTKKHIFNKILRIVRCLEIDTFYTTYVKVVLYFAHKKTFLNRIPDNLKNLKQFNAEEVEKRVFNFFNEQTKSEEKTQSKILSIINFQEIAITLKNVFDGFSDLNLNSEISILEPENSTTFIEDPKIKFFVDKYLGDFNIKKAATSKPQIKSNLKEDEIEIIEFLKKCFDKFITKIQIHKDKIQEMISKEYQKDVSYYNRKYNDFIKPERDYFKIIFFGSYTTHLINNEIKYNDIDIYTNKSLEIMVIMLLVFHFIYNIDINIQCIPYIIGHSALRFKEEHFSDCIYLDNETLKRLKTIEINNIKILDPTIQVLNNIRMFSELRRMSNVSKDNKNTKLKLMSLLTKMNEIYKIDFSKLEYLPKLHYELLEDDTFCLINLNKTFNYSERDKRMFPDLFDYILIPLSSSLASVMELLKRDDVRISRQYSAVFNEIIAEFNNRKSVDILKNIPSTSSDLKNKQTILVHETKLEKVELVNDVNVFSKKIENIIKKHNVLFLTNFSSNIYYNVNYGEEKKTLLSRELSKLTQETFLASFVLYCYLKKQDATLLNIYLSGLFSFINNNRKNDLINFSNTVCSSENKIVYKNKIKLLGKHRVFSLNPINLFDIFRKKNQTYDFYNYNDFKDVINYTEKK